MLLGAWGIRFDASIGEFYIEPARGFAAHSDITELLSPPECDDCLEIEVVDFQPEQHQVKAKLKLRNESELTVHDVRAIMLSKAAGLKLLNPDGYTGLWDDGGDLTINPFKAFATDQPDRTVLPGTGHARVCELYYPVFAALVHAVLVVDASWPGNCSEPYEIRNFQQETIYNLAGYTGLISIDVFDWQDDVESVVIDASEVTGKEFNAFAYSAANMWETVIESQSPTPGTYECLVTAVSAGSEIPLYDHVEITVMPLPVDVDALFAEPSLGERNAVLADWAARDVAVHDYVLEGQAFYPDNSTLMVVSHTLSGERHYGAIRIPPGTYEPDSLPVLIKTHGGGEGTGDFAFSPSGIIGDYFIQVLPTFRGEPLYITIGPLVGIYQSEGHSNAYDTDADDTIALLSVCLENVEAADETRIAIAGGSRGGGTALRAKVRDDRILAAVSFAAATDFFAGHVKAAVIAHLLDSEFPGTNPVENGVIEEVVDPILQGEMSIEAGRRLMLLGSPAYFVEYLPRVQVHHGALDLIVPVEQGDSLQNQMNLAGITAPDYEYFRYETGTHDTSTYTGYTVKYLELLTYVLEYEG